MPGLNPLLNAVELYAANAAGTGNVTLGALINPNAFTMAEAGAVDGQPYVFRFDAANGDFEISRCTYSSAGPSVSRDVVLASKISNVVGTSKISISTSTTCRVVFAGDDAITRSQQLQRSWLVGG